MKSQKTIKKLELKKETIVRLNGNELFGIQGGNTGPEPSLAIHNQCTLTDKTRINKYTCNALICNKTA